MNFHSKSFIKARHLLVNQSLGHRGERMWVCWLSHSLRFAYKTRTQMITAHLLFLKYSVLIAAILFWRNSVIVIFINYSCLQVALENCLSVDGEFKATMKSSIPHWHADEVMQTLAQGVSLKDLKVDLWANHCMPIGWCGLCEQARYPSFWVEGNHWLPRWKVYSNRSCYQIKLCALAFHWLRQAFGMGILHALECFLCLSEWKV